MHVGGICELRVLEEWFLENAIIIETNNQHLYNLSKLRKIRISDGMNEFLQKSASIQTVEHLHLDLCQINELFVIGLSRFRHLRHVNIKIDSDFDYIEFAHIIWQELQKLKEITELHINYSYKYQLVDKFMNNLVLNNLNFKQLTSTGLMCRPGTLLNLTMLENLKSLHLTIHFPDDYIAHNTIARQPLKRFNQIKSLNLQLSRPSATCFFKELACYNTLTKLSISCLKADDEIFQLNRNCSNLEKF